MPRGIPNRRAVEAAPVSEAPMLETPETPLVSARATEMRRERRRREPGDIDVMARQKLAIPPEVKDKLEREGLTPRWGLDTSGRVQQLQAEEWDIVPGVQHVSASRADASQHVLMAKRKDWYEEDRQHLKDFNKATEKAAIGGKESEEGVDRKGFYAPTGTVNRISRGA